MAKENPTIADMPTKEQIIELLQDKDVYMNGGEKFDAEMVAACPNLKLLMCVRDGAEESIDVKACEEVGLPVLSGGGRCMVSVAELTLCFMLLMARPVVAVSNYIKQNGWTKENSAPVRAMYNDFSTELWEKTAGIIGLGRNGYQLAQYCKAMNMKVISYDPYKDKEAMAKEDIEMVDLDTLMKTADYVIILARVTDDNYHMINREKIEMMKPNAVLINPARGKLLETDALLDALEQDKIRGACLDAHETEPLGLDNREMKFDQSKLILTPHMAGKTAERNWHQYQLLLEQFRKFIAGEPVRMIYTPKAPEAEGWNARGGKLIELFK